MRYSLRLIGDKCLERQSCAESNCTQTGHESAFVTIALSYSRINMCRIGISTQPVEHCQVICNVILAFIVWRTVWILHLVGDVFRSSIISKCSEQMLTSQCADRIARNIIKSRAQKPIETTLELAELVKHSVPQKASRHSHPAQKTFQALRIAVNGELDDLGGAVDAMFDGLSVGGRLAIITFHSLEDRIVKNRFGEFCKGCTCPPEFPVCVCGKTPRGRLIFRSIVPSDEEIENNRRARSARLRAVEKIKD